MNGLTTKKRYLEKLYQVGTSKLTIDTIWSTGANFVVKLRGFLLIFIIGRLAGVEWYGAWSLVFALASYGTIIGTLMLPDATVRFSRKKTQTTKRVFSYFYLQLYSYYHLALPL